MKKELYDAYATYCEIIQKGKPVDQLTNEELRQYMLIDRDEKFKKIFEKAGDKVLPLTTIVPQYNALIDQEIAKQKEATMMDDVKTMPNPDVILRQLEERVNYGGEAPSGPHTHDFHEGIYSNPTESAGAFKNENQEYNPAATLEEASAVFSQTPAQAPAVAEQAPAKAEQAPSKSVEGARGMTLDKTLKNVPVKQESINQIGYANIVLMSIIVIIIVAIICVFIFM